jgi:methionine-rich copper-binding protein CopC
LDLKFVMMKANSIFKITAIIAALLCGNAVAHAQKAKDKPAKDKPVVVSVPPTVEVRVEPKVKVEVKTQKSKVTTTINTTTATTTTTAAKATTKTTKPTTVIRITPVVSPRVAASPAPRAMRPFISEQTAAADQNVIVSLSVLSGSITVHGSDRRDVRVQTNDEKRIELRRKDGTGGNSPATRLQVLFYDSDENGGQADECGGSTDVKMDVPRGATVILKTQEGDIDVSDVAEASAYTSNGDVALRRVARSVEAKSNSGDVTLRDAGGHVRLNTISGSVEAINVNATDGGDFLQAKTVSGDVTLEGIGPARVEASTISGDLNLTGALAPGGHYDFNTTSGDITLTLPGTVSFKLDAQVFTSGEINTGFPIKQVGKIPNASPPTSGTLIGTYGSGDATINLSSYSGTLRLIKK